MCVSLFLTFAIGSTTIKENSFALHSFCKGGKGRRLLWRQQTHWVKRLHFVRKVQNIRNWYFRYVNKHCRKSGPLCTLKMASWKLTCIQIGALPQCDKVEKSTWKRTSKDLSIDVLPSSLRQKEIPKVVYPLLDVFKPRHRPRFLFYWYS